MGENATAAALLTQEGTDLKLGNQIDRDSSNSGHVLQGL